jgi:hypothetical protein
VEEKEVSATSHDDAPLFRAVSAGQETAHFHAVAAEVEAKERGRASRERAMILALIVAVPVAASGWAAWALKPRIETQFSYVVVDPSGQQIPRFDFASLPENLRGNLVLNSAWAYLAAREGFSTIQASSDWYRVQSMSAPAVFTEYASVDDPRLPTSKWRRLGEGTRYQITYLSHRPLCDAACGPNGEPNGVEFTYRRVEVKDGVVDQASMSQQWVARMRFDVGVQINDGAAVAVFNAARLRITQYVPGVRMGAVGGR